MSGKSFRTPFALSLIASAFLAAPAAAQTETEPVQEDAAGEQEPATPPTRSFSDYAETNPATAPAGEGTSTAPDGDWRRLTEAELMAPTREFPHMEWHGYFRFRADSFWNLDLDTEGTSPILPPVEALLSPDNDYADPGAQINAGSDDVTNADAEHLGGANIRLRVNPIIHVTEKTRIHLELNILDNLVMGSTPDGYNESSPTGLRTDMPIIGFTGTQEPLNYSNALRDSVSVTQAFGEVNTFFGTLRLGRMASQWGLGILANGGGSYSHLREPRVSNRGVSMAGHGCLDCDYGDYVDRAMFTTNLFNTYLVLAWDYNYAGPTSLKPEDYFGQPGDVSQYDDVRSIVVALFQRPLRPEEIASRNRTLKELRRPTFDWGAYFVARRQRISAEGYTAGVDGTNFDRITYVNREARAFIPDVWFRVLSEPRFRTRIRLEGEFAAILGTIGNADPRGQSDDKERKIQQFAGALEFDYTRNALATGINTGFATGRTFDEDPDGYVGFGVQDAWTLDDSEPTITNFKFDRNYFVDAIMFREIIGTVTNAVYLNPFFQYDLFAKQDDALGARLDLVTAFAMSPDATPSGEGFYGVETDLTIYYREPNYGADIMAGVFIPGSAFDALDGNPRMPTVAQRYGVGASVPFDGDQNATPAWTLQGRFFWAF